MTYTITESNDCKTIIIKPAETDPFNSRLIALTIHLAATHGELVRGEKTITKNANGEYLYELTDEAGERILIPDGICELIISGETQLPLVLKGQVETEIYRRLRYNVNNEKIQPQCYKEALYQYTMLKSLSVLQGLSDFDTILKLLKSLSKYTAFNVDYISK